MTALILVVDDIPANVKLLEAKLNGEYYDVITARDGLEAIEKVKQHKPDLILLDVMMPGMDGFETCRHLKADKEVSHIPVVMVTALSEPSDRVQGLEAGADDFITKPINDTALFARVRSLVRMKVLMDELRLRDQTGLDMGVMSGDGNTFTSDVSGSHIVVIDDDVVQCKKISERFGAMHQITLLHNPAELNTMIRENQRPVDLYMINTHLTEADGLRLATHIKSIESERHVPIIMLVDEEDTHLMLKGLELGINDYLIIPIDYNEMQARIKTQIRRKKYQDALKSNYQASISMAITDKLTGLYNRHYLDTHLNNMTRNAMMNQKFLSLMIMDMDHFKSVNDTFGHDVGDEVLRQLSAIIVDSVRSSDLAARFGGEEFVVLMPESDFQAAYGMAERLRKKVEEFVFHISHAQGILSKTLSIGVSTLNLHGDSAAELIKRADSALYEAKHGGRNKVMPQLNAMPVVPRSTPVMDAPQPVQQVVQMHPQHNQQPMFAQAHPVAQGHPMMQQQLQQQQQMHQPAPQQMMQAAQPVYQATIQPQLQPSPMPQQPMPQHAVMQAQQPMQQSQPQQQGFVQPVGVTTMGAVMGTAPQTPPQATPTAMPLPLAVPLPAQAQSAPVSYHYGVSQAPVTTTHVAQPAQPAQTQSLAPAIPAGMPTTGAQPKPKAPEPDLDAGF